MWNFQLVGLACGARIILYDGSPFYPDLSTYLRLVNDQGYEPILSDDILPFILCSITVLGTSPRFLAEVLGQGIKPCKIPSALSCVKLIILTQISGGYWKVWRSSYPDGHWGCSYTAHVWMGPASVRRTYTYRLHQWRHWYMYILFVSSLLYLFSTAHTALRSVVTGTPSLPVYAGGVLTLVYQLWELSDVLILRFRNPGESTWNENGSLRSSWE